MNTFIVLWEKQEAMVNRKSEKCKEFRVEIINLKTEYFNQEIDDAEMGGTVYTVWHKTIIQGEQDNLEY